MLDIRVVDSAGHLIAQPTTYTVTSEMLEMAFISVALDVAPLPTTTLLLQNYPNPFNPETWIPYQLSEAAPVTITIYNVAGQIVRSLVLGHQEAGFYRGRSQAAYWDGRNNHNEPVASGIYFYQIEFDKKLRIGFNITSISFTRNRPNFHSCKLLNPN